jgi:hypothetical protein
MDNTHHESLYRRFYQELRHIGRQSLTEPLTITKNGRDRFALVEAEEFARLMRRDRKVYGLGETPHELFDLIQQSKMPKGFEYLDEELKDWKP